MQKFNFNLTQIPSFSTLSCDELNSRAAAANAKAMATMAALGGPGSCILL